MPNVEPCNQSRPISAGSGRCKEQPSRATQHFKCLSPAISDLPYGLHSNLPHYIRDWQQEPSRITTSSLRDLQGTHTHRRRPCSCTAGNRRDDTPELPPSLITYTHNSLELHSLKLCTHQISAPADLHPDLECLKPLSALTGSLDLTASGMLIIA